MLSLPWLKSHQSGLVRRLQSNGPSFVRIWADLFTCFPLVATSPSPPPNRQLCAHTPLPMLWLPADTVMKRKLSNLNEA